MKKVKTWRELREEKIEEMTRLAKRVYGDEWQTKLSVDEKVNDRTVRRWVSGDSRVPVSVLNSLRSRAELLKIKEKESKKTTV